MSERQAIAHAQLGDEVAFRSAITAARRELDRGQHETDPHWTRTVSHTEITVFEALGKEALGAPAQAVRLRQAVLDDPVTWPITEQGWPEPWCRPETSTRRSHTAW